MLDGCSCCLVCARQRGESCSPLLPCDESSGLYCDRGPEDGGGAAGICMGRWRRTGGPVGRGRHGVPRLPQPSPRRWGHPPRLSPLRCPLEAVAVRSSPGEAARPDGCGGPSAPCRCRSGVECDRPGLEGAGGAGCPLPQEMRSLSSLVLEGDNCVFDGMIYRNGETFQPSCKYQCTCRDGQIGCLPRCNLDLLLPGPDCPFPRKIEVPGECCEKWICDPKDEVILGGFAMAGEETKTITVIVRRR